MNQPASQEIDTSGLHQAVLALRQHLNERIVGQGQLVDRLLVALLADGHLLVEGAPGLAKTTAVKALAASVEGDFHRIQFTPDLLPADLTGTEVFRPQQGVFEFQRGPIFHNVILADEVNRAPAKVQSALLEAMEERQVTSGRNTFALPQLFMVMATQNPIEQEGTYPLPEAQLDRFLMQVCIDYPEASAEREILALSRQRARVQMSQLPVAKPLLSQAQVFAARLQVLDVHLAPALEDYMLQVLLATRQPAAWGEQLGRWLRFGASPRGTIALDRCARAHAWLQGRDYATPEDVHAVVIDVLRHRILLSYEAEADGIDSEHFLRELLRSIPLP